jgi:uncharacterized protein YhaN
MRITDINIDRFGVWRELSLPLNAAGVTVFYGPNEAGKSTLMRFVRGTLYGFNPDGARVTRHGHSTEAKGSLRITHDGHAHSIDREADAGQRGRLRVDQLDWGTISQERVKSFLNGTSEEMFENIFAIGLSELQELATLDADEVARHIYGLSLGPDGERILRASRQFERQRALLLSDDHSAGEVVELAQKLARIDQQLAELASTTQKHQHLRSERDRLSTEIEMAERRRQTLQDNLRGYRFLERVHAPWSRERKLRGEHSALSLPHSFPSDGLSRYDTLDRQIADQRKKRARLLEEARKLYRQAGEQTGDTTLLQHECTIRRLADEREDISRRERRLAEKQAHADKLKRQLEARIAGVGGRWSAEGLSDTQKPAAGLGSLLQVSRLYQTALRKKGRSVTRYKRLNAAAQKRQATFNEQLKTLRGMSLNDAIKATRQQLGEVEELNRLRLDEARLSGQAQQPRRPQLQPQQVMAGVPTTTMKFRDLPPLFFLVMTFFTGAGLALFFCGLWWASTYNNVMGHTAWIVGAIYSCFGLMMSGITWTVRQHFEQFFEGGLNGDGRFALKGTVAKQPVVVDAPQVDANVDRDLARVRRSIAQLVERSTLPGLRQSLAEGGELVGSDVLLRTAQRLADLELLKRQQEKIAADRQRLSKYRELLRQRQRDVGLRRREWCDVLRDLGLDETLKVDKAIGQWQALMEAGDLRREHALQLEMIERDRQAIAAHRQDFERLTGLLPTTHMVGLKADPNRLLPLWLEEIRKAGGLTEEQLRLKREGREKRKQATKLERTISDLQAQQNVLFLQAGVSSRTELEQRSQSLVRHQELARLLEEAQLELQLVAEEEPELAVVEDDLLTFKAGNNKRRITDGEVELRQIDGDIQKAREELGRVKRELDELAGDRRAVTLRFEREQLADRLLTSTERWCALELAGDAIDRIRHRMERHCQSETLQLSSKYLSQLTLGKYQNIWAPLGERHLSIDDDAEQTFSVEQLSTGTREQLFLAIRLAMIRRFADEGTELPLVLDDVFVNFDQTRTEAAVETILDVADAGQQVLLFTCHLHLADIFEEKGVDAVWLPEKAGRLEERKAG